MKLPRALVIAAAGALTIAGALIAAPAASADSVWFQSVARASASAACPDDSFGTPWQSNWDPAQRSWRPSWAQWPNGGTGGFTCDRQITWAKSGSVYPVGYCQGASSRYYQFNGGWSVSGLVSDPIRFYSDSSCTSAITIGAYDFVVYAPAGYAPDVLCREAFGIAGAPTALGGDVFLCGSVV